MEIPEPDFTIEELIQELEAVSPPRGGEGYTTRELAEKSGKSVKAILRLLHVLDAEGRLEPTQKGIIGIDGLPHTVPAYRLLRLEGGDGALDG